MNLVKILILCRPTMKIVHDDGTNEESLDWQRQQIFVHLDQHYANE